MSQTLIGHLLDRQTTSKGLELSLQKNKIMLQGHYMARKGMSRSKSPISDLSSFYSLIGPLNECRAHISSVASPF